MKGLNPVPPAQRVHAVATSFASRYIGRSLEPEGIADVAVFVFSDEKSGVASDSLLVDGGATVEPRNW